MKRLLVVFSVMLAFLGMIFVAPFTTSANAATSSSTMPGQHVKSTSIMRNRPRR